MHTGLFTPSITLQGPLSQSLGAGEETKTGRGKVSRPKSWDQGQKVLESCVLKVLDARLCGPSNEPGLCVFAPFSPANARPNSHPCWCVSSSPVPASPASADYLANPRQRVWRSVPTFPDTALTLSHSPKTGVGALCWWVGWVLSKRQPWWLSLGPPVPSLMSSHLSDHSNPRVDYGAWHELRHASIGACGLWHQTDPQ